MAYSTGSGDYVALMAAVLAHAVADGWIEAGGIGTGWPISKGNVRGLDWNTYTVGNTDYTSGSGVPKTTRWIQIAPGTTPADATTNANTATAAHFPNMEYTFDAWHIFSDPSIGDHVNVVVQFSNGFDQKVFGHFSFGELNKHGMTYGGLAYASGHPCRGFSPDQLSDENNSNDAASGIYARVERHMTGQLGYEYTSYFVANPVCYMVDSVDNPFPNLPNWPDPNLLYNNARMLDTYGPSSGSFDPQSTDPGIHNAKFAHAAMFTTAQPYSGGVSLMPIPLLVSNTTSNSATLRFINLGSFPNVRTCSLSTLLEGDEITFAGDTWVVFPFLSRKNRSTLGQKFTVTSGLHGLAYKKVL